MAFWRATSSLVAVDAGQHLARAYLVPLLGQQLDHHAGGLGDDHGLAGRFQVGGAGVAGRDRAARGAGDFDRHRVRLLVAGLAVLACLRAGFPLAFAGVLAASTADREGTGQGQHAGAGQEGGTGGTGGSHGGGLGRGVLVA